MLIQDHFAEPRPDRRREKRHAMSRPCKVRHAPTGRYLAAETRDVSLAGAMLTIDCPRAIQPGDQIDLLIAWDDRALLHDEDSRKGTVVRVMQGPGQRQYVGIALTEELGARASARMAA